MGQVRLFTESYCLGGLARLSLAASTSILCAPVASPFAIAGCDEAIAGVGGMEGELNGNLVSVRPKGARGRGPPGSVGSTAGAAGGGKEAWERTGSRALRRCPNTG